MTKMIRQTMFKTGEVDPTTWKRTDVEEYLSAAQSLQNCLVGTTGLIKKRFGSERVYDATGKAEYGSRMYEFVDKNQDHYIVLGAEGKFYIFDAPTDEAFVVTKSGSFVVTGRGNNVVAHSGELSFIGSVNTSYLASDIAELDYTRDNDSLIVTHPNYAPSRIYISSYSPLTFAFETLDIYPLPAYDFGSINYNDFSVSLGVVGDTLTFQFTGLGADPGFTSAWIGGQIIGGGASDLSPVGYAIITNVSYGGGTVTFTATVQIPFLTSGYATRGSQYSVRQPAWSSDLGYPAKCTYYQSRLWLARTKALPETVFGSKINAPINFDVGTGKDTDAIIYTLGVTDSGAINWLNAGAQLEVLCENIEFACPQNENAALTPSTFTVKPQSSYGAYKFMKPVTYINDSYFAGKTGKSYINYHFNGIGLKYTSTNISAASQHLMKQPTNRALIRGDDNSQDNFIFMANRSDNTLTAFQFESESKLAALTPITFQDDVSVIDIVTVDNELYILKYYDLVDQYIIERFLPDLKIDGRLLATMASTGVVTGLSAFEGYEVSVVYQNQDYGQYTVSGGQITVSNPEENAGEVQIGLLYDVNIETMFYYFDTAAAPFMKNTSLAYVDYYNSLDFYINGTLVPYQNFDDIMAGLPLQPQTDTAIVATLQGWSRFDTLTITQSSPFDLQILSIGYQIDMAVI